jgi:uncharacterized protein DUF4394
MEHVPMRSFRFRQVALIIAFIVAATIVVTPVKAQGGGTIYAVTTKNALVAFSPASPLKVVTIGPITGLQPGENILGIDFRPANGVLYGLGSTSRLYTINITNGAATAVGGQFATPLSGRSFGFDFNPAVDRIRVISDAKQNLRLHPDTGAVAAVDTPLTKTGYAVAAAYDRSVPGTPQTTLYIIDSASDILGVQGGVNGSPSPNGGVVTRVGRLLVNTSDQIGFDIAADSSIAYASLTLPGATNSRLFTVDLQSGKATSVGLISARALIRDIAYTPAPLPAAPATN